METQPGDVIIPAMGMAMEDALLIEWLKQPGDEVADGEVVALIETDKSTMEVEAARPGRLGAHRFTEGTRVAVGTPITRVLGPGESEEDAPAATAAPDAPAAQSAAASSAPAPSATGSPADGVGRTGPYRPPHDRSPRQRRLDREAATVPASPALAAVPATAPAPVASSAVASSAADDGVRARASAHLARAVTESWTTIPHFAVSREIDVTDLLHYLDGVRRSAPQVSVTDLILQATARAWRGVRPGAPDGAGLSVAADDRRVVNIAVPGAASLGLAELAERRRAAVARARRGVLAVADQSAVEVTVSNLGTHGVDWFTGVIPVGQVGLFTIGRIRSGLDVSTDSFRIRKLMWVTANLDHRELDGADGGVLLDLFQQACSVSLGDPFGAADPERKAQR